MSSVCSRPGVTSCISSYWSGVPEFSSYTHVRSTLSSFSQLTLSIFWNSLQSGDCAKKIHGRLTKKIDSVRPHYEAAFLNPFFIHSTFLREQKKKILSTENKISWHRFAKLWQYVSPFIHTHKVSNLGLFRSTQNVHPGRIWGTKTGVHSL